MTDTERFEVLFRAHRPQVLAYARRRVDAATAEDVVADAFLVCWRRLDDVPSEALPWLLGVARRCLANRVRGDARRLALAERAAGAEVATGGDPAEALGERERVLAAFTGLSERDREVLALVAWEGLDVAPIEAGNAFRDRNRRDLAATFREAVDAKTVSDRGRATFEGRAAQRFAVTRGLDGIDAFDWYVEPGSGRPLGAIERIGDQVRTERLERYDKLEPEGAALAALS